MEHCKLLGTVGNIMPEEQPRSPPNLLVRPVGRRKHQVEEPGERKPSLLDFPWSMNLWTCQRKAQMSRTDGQASYQRIHLRPTMKTRMFNKPPMQLRLRS